MAIALDASSPAAVGSSGASTTTAAFTPPNACVIVAMVQADANNGNNGETVSASDSSSGTWNTAVLGNGNGGAVSAIFWRLCPTSISNLTVSCADSFGAVAKRLVVQVWTGTDQTNPIGATVAGTTAAVSYTSTVNNSQGVSCGLTANATLTAGGTGNTLIDEAGGFDSGDAVFTLNRAALTTPAGSTVTLTIAGTATIGHHVAAELVPPGASAPALPPPMPRRRIATGRTTRPRAATTVPPQLPVPAEIDQPRRTRAQTVRRARTVTPVRAQVNPPNPIADIVQPRRPRGLLPRRGRQWSPPYVPVAAAPPPWIPPSRRDRQQMPALRRGGRVLQPPWPQASVTNPVQPLGLVRRVLRLLVPARKPRTAQPTHGVQPPVGRLRIRPVPAVQHRGHAIPPVGVPLAPTAPPLAPALIRPRPARPMLRRPRMPLLVVASATCDCLVHRPNTGTTARPGTGTAARPFTGVTSRPCSC